MKKSLIDTLLTETPPDDYLQKEAEELEKRKQLEELPAENWASKGLSPEWTLLAMMAGFAGIMAGVGYLLIF
ncbi:hypothetical protein [Domibacillus robiginosus]|uniref:hypothetical protein n=1 Tax=Domibacillus robiginosus TaxID=1071054 RepID=UPI0012E015D5|nr:hypothetical protein [Domibacillus robiginosus]